VSSIRHRQLTLQRPILGSAFLFERFGVLTGQTIKDKDFRELFYVDVPHMLHCIMAAWALRMSGLGLSVNHDGGSIGTVNAWHVDAQDAARAAAG